MPEKSTPDPIPNNPPNKLSQVLGIPSFGMQDLVALSILAGIIVLIFWKVLFTSQMLYFRDVFNTSYPNARFTREMLRSGHLPYWNPYLNWGQDFLANPNSLVFYPTTLLLMLLPLNLAYALHYVLHFVIGAAGVYLLARRWNQSSCAAFFAAAIFSLSGPILSLGNFYNMEPCAMWLPWALYMTDRALDNRSLRPWILLTVIFALQFLAGEPFTLISSFTLCVCYALYRRGSLRRPFSQTNLQILFFFAAVGILMIALSAVQFFPSLSLLATSHRGEGMGFKQSTYWSFHPLLLFEVVVPEFFGGSFGTPSAWKEALNFHNAPFLVSYFIGAIPMIFALAGWALGKEKRKNFVMLAAVILLVMAMGRFTPIYELLFATIPFLHLVRFPVKLLIPFTVLVALLAGWGFDALRQPAEDIFSRRKRFLAPLLAIFSLLAIVLATALVAPQLVIHLAGNELKALNSIFVLRPSQELTTKEITEAGQFFLYMLKLFLPGLIGYALGGIAWVVLLGKDHVWARRAVPWVAALGLILLAKANYSANPTVPESFYTYRPPVLKHFVNSGGPYRFIYINHLDPNEKHGLKLQNFLNFDNIPEVAGLPNEALGLFREKLLLQWGSMLTGYENGSSSDVDAALPDSFYEFWEYLRDSEVDVSKYDCLLGRTNVKYLVVRRKTDSLTSREVTEIFNGSLEPSYLYQSECYVPRTYAVASALYSQNVKQTLATLSDPNFDALGQVVLNDNPEADVILRPPGPAGKVEIVERLPNSVKLHAEMINPGYVLLLDRDDPNWHATVDGKEVQIHRANLMFRAVRCAAGNHEIHFYFRQRGLRAGAALTLAAAALMVLMFWKNPQPRRKSTP